MSQKIKVLQISDVFNKAGERVSGTSKNGNKWTMFKINEEYAYFHYGDGDLRIEEGQEYDFEISQNEKGKTARLISQKDIKADFNHQELMTGLRAIYKLVKELEEKLVEKSLQLEDIERYIKNDKR